MPTMGLDGSSFNVAGSKILDPSWVNFLFLRSGWVSHLWFEFGPGKFPLKIPNFKFFPFFEVKKSLLGRSKSTWVKDVSAS